MPDQCLTNGTPVYFELELCMKANSIEHIKTFLYFLHPTLKLNVSYIQAILMQQL